MQRHETSCIIMQYHSISFNSMQHHAILCNVMKHHALSCNIIQYHLTSYNIMQYYAKSRSNCCTNCFIFLLELSVCIFVFISIENYLSPILKHCSRSGYLTSTSAMTYLCASICSAGSLSLSF